MNKKVIADFSKPQEVSDALMAFPGDIKHLMPEYENIPDEFKSYGGGGGNAWITFARRWFYEGLPGVSFYGKDGIDPEKAYRHLHCIQGSFQPKQEHKEAAVAYLASLWLEGYTFAGASA